MYVLVEYRQFNSQRQEPTYRRLVVKQQCQKPFNTVNSTSLLLIRVRKRKELVIQRTLFEESW